MSVDMFVEYTECSYVIDMFAQVIDMFVDDMFVEYTECSYGIDIFAYVR